MYALLFPRKGTSDYVMTRGVPSLKAVTVCLWMKTADTGNAGTLLSYAVSGRYNELLLLDYNNFWLWLGDNHRYKHDVLKVSKVTSVDKGGELTDPSNFRPISTLSALTQIFEKLVYKQLINYIEKHDILFQFQFGFRKGHSTAQAVSEIADNLREAIDNNLYTCGVFIDFSKAFDTVNHEILLKKLESYGIRGMPLKWLTSYLNNRQQYVAIGHTESPRQAMTCGSPQGSTLGPLLFLLYINDLSNCSETLTFRVFADDTNLFASAGDLKNLETLINSELGKVKVWCDVNKLSINFIKTNYMIIKSNRKASGGIEVKL